MTFYQYSVNKSVVSFLFNFISHKLLHGWPLISCMNVYKSIISFMFDFISCKLYAWVAIDPLYELLIFIVRKIKKGISDLVCLNVVVMIEKPSIVL